MKRLLTFSYSTYANFKALYDRLKNQFKTVVLKYRSPKSVIFEVGI